VLFDERVAACLYTFSFVAKKPGGLDGLLKYRGIGLRIIGRRAKFLEQVGRDKVHPLVGALGGKDSGNEQLQRIGMVQLTVRIRISFFQPGDYLFYAGGFGFSGFSRHAAMEG
jgi:hypothetical protein